MAEYVTCPTCGLKVLTADALLGRTVRCSGCDDRFLASPDPPPASGPTRAAAALANSTASRRARFSSEEEDDDEDWPFCPGCGRQVTWNDLACPHCGEEFEEEQAPRLARPLDFDVSMPVRRDGEPDRGRLLLALGSASAIAGAGAVCFGYTAVISVPLGLTVWILASRDLKRMENGSVDPRGRGLTRRARTAAKSGVFFGVLLVAVFMALLFMR
jgi:DNA-directed RNA polymerase subunit RPC12/RpoP